MSVVAYVQYHLLNLDGAGMQPYHQVTQGGMIFDGGYYRRAGKYLGYIFGETELAADTIAAMSPWRVMELTASEALAWAEEVQPVNTAIDDIDGGTQYVGPAEINEAGRVHRPLSDTPWEV